MNRLPAVVIGAALGASAFVGAEQLLDRPPQATYAVERLQNCASQIGHSIVPEAIDQACKEYSQRFVPKAVSRAATTNRDLTYTLPTQVDLLTKDLAPATATDQEIVRINAVTQQNRLGGSILAGVLVMASSSYYARKIHLPAARNSKKQPSGAPAA